MRFWTVLASAVSGVVLVSGAAVRADAIPYAAPGTLQRHRLHVQCDGDGRSDRLLRRSGASFDNEVGVLDNGVLTSAGFGLDNHTSAAGASFDFGSVTAGDTLTFVLQDNTLGKDAYSDPLLNDAYDGPGDTIGHNHVYSTAYTAAGPIIPGVPTGTYLAFEDLPFPDSDFNYDDETFVFANTSLAPVAAAPEPSAWLLMGLGVGGVGLALRFGKRSLDVEAAAV